MDDIRQAFKSKQIHLRVINNKKRSFSDEYTWNEVWIKKEWYYFQNSNKIKIYFIFLHNYFNSFLLKVLAHMLYLTSKYLYVSPTFIFMIFFHVRICLRPQMHIQIKQAQVIKVKKGWQKRNTKIKMLHNIWLILSYLISYLFFCRKYISIYKVHSIKLKTISLYSANTVLVSYCLMSTKHI